LIIAKQVSSPFTLLKVDGAEHENVPAHRAYNASDIHTFEFDLVLHVNGLEVRASGFLNSSVFVAFRVERIKYLR
jgi:hypothetical protein